MGTGEQTIVLLPGLGVSPSIPYRPLMEELAEKYTAVCIEYFGYGFSDGTYRPKYPIPRSCFRSNEYGFSCRHTCFGDKG